MQLQATSDSPRAARYATELFTRWLDELPDGALRSHVATLALEFRDLPPDDLTLLVYCEPTAGGYMIGHRNFDNRAELIGPYVAPRYRENGLGKELVQYACLSASARADVYLLVPGAQQRAQPVLESIGFHPVAPYLPGGAGDHLAFHANQLERATGSLKRNGEPRGSGPWVVRLLDDDTTTFPFVCQCLARVLDITEVVACEHAIVVHNAGSAVIRYCRTQSGANGVAKRIAALARMGDFPLKAVVEKR